MGINIDREKGFVEYVPVKEMAELSRETLTHILIQKIEKDPAICPRCGNANDGSRRKKKIKCGTCKFRYLEDNSRFMEAYRSIKSSDAYERLKDDPPELPYSVFHEPPHQIEVRYEDFEKPVAFIEAVQGATSGTSAGFYHIIFTNRRIIGLHVGDDPSGKAFLFGGPASRLKMQQRARKKVPPLIVPEDLDNLHISPTDFSIAYRDISSSKMVGRMLTINQKDDPRGKNKKILQFTREQRNFASYLFRHILDVDCKGI